MGFEVAAATGLLPSIGPVVLITAAQDTGRVLLAKVADVGIAEETKPAGSSPAPPPAEQACPDLPSVPAMIIAKPMGAVIVERQLVLPSSVWLMVPVNATVVRATGLNVPRLAEVLKGPVAQGRKGLARANATVPVGRATGRLEARIAKTVRPKPWLHPRRTNTAFAQVS